MSTAPRVLVVYANPAITATPTPPLGAQRIRAVLHGAGCETAIVAPWLEIDPAAELQAALDDLRPDLVCFSVRNVDDGLVVRSAEGSADIDTRSYLGDVRPLVEQAQDRAPVLVGGAAVATSPRGVLRVLGARWGVAGPAEDVAWWLGKALVDGAPFPDALPDDPRVVDLQDPTSTGTQDARDSTAVAAERWQPSPGSTPRMEEYTALLDQRGGWAPVPFVVGCDRRCRFCVEASFLGGGTRVVGVERTLNEIQALHERTGLRRFWLTGSEINVPDAAAATALFRGVAERRLEIEVRGFMQPAPVDDDLLDAMERAGVDPEGLSFEFGHLDEGLLRAGAGPASRRAIDALVELWQRRGYRTLGGSLLLGAHPEETWQTIDRAIDAAREIDDALPGGLGLAYATGGRVYAASPLGRWVRAHREDAAPDLHGAWSDDFADPLVFSRPAPPRELFGHVQRGLADCRGAMAPLNAEMLTDPKRLGVERLVNAAIVRTVRGRPKRARVALEQATALDPGHTEALKQLALLLANDLDDRDAAIATLRQLRDLVEGSQAKEVDIALWQLGGLET